MVWSESTITNSRSFLMRSGSCYSLRQYQKRIEKWAFTHQKILGNKNLKRFSGNCDVTIMKDRNRLSSGYGEYHKLYHKIWIEQPGKRDKWNTYQRARTLKQNMIRENSSYFKGRIQSHIQYNEQLCAYKAACLFKRLTTVSKLVFRRRMAEKGYTVDFGVEVTVSTNLDVPSC